MKIELSLHAPDEWRIADCDSAFLDRFSPDGHPAEPWLLSSLLVSPGTSVPEAGGSRTVILLASDGGRHLLELNCESSDGRDRRFCSLRRYSRTHHPQALVRFLARTFAFDPRVYPDKLTQVIYEELGFDYVFLAVPATCEMDQAETLSFRVGGESVDNLSYPLWGSPCLVAYESGMAYCATGVRTAYPEDKELVTLEADSYFAIAFYGADKQPIGHVGMIHKEAMPAREDIENVVLSLSQSIVTFLEQREIVDQLEQASRANSVLSAQSEALLDGLLIVDEHQKIVSCNKRFQELWGISDALLATREDEELLGFAVRQLVDPESFLAKVQYLYEHKDETSRDRIDLKDGRVFDRYSASVRGPLGEDFGRIWMFRDSTADMRREKRLEELVQEAGRAQQQADLANHAKSLFLATMSHELRTPLNAIIGFSELINRDGGLRPKQAEYVNLIHANGEQLLTLINDILDISRIEAGKLTLADTPFSLHQALRSRARTYRARAAEAGLDFRYEQAGDLPDAVAGDQSKMLQILDNLAFNALKYTEAGSVVMRSRLVGDGGGGEGVFRVALEVEDTGPGIPEEEQEGLFHAFTQTSVTRRRSVQGTGLGLSISASLARLFGGVVRVESEVGVGSTFTAELELRSAGEEELADVTARTVVGLAEDQAPPRVLVIEDNPENRRVIHDYMQPVGFRIREAEDAERGLELYSAWTPDLILMDLQLPGIDGVEATRRVRDLPGGGEVKIVALTASALEETKQAALAAGCDAFLTKPVRSNAVLDCVGEQLGLRYRYQAGAAEEQPDGPEPPVPTAGAAAPEIDPHTLNQLPEGWRDQLVHAVRALRHDDVSTLLSDLGAVDPGLAETLQDLARQFRYRDLLAALE